MYGFQKGAWVDEFAANKFLGARPAAAGEGDAAVLRGGPHQIGEVAEQRSIFFLAAAEGFFGALASANVAADRRGSGHMAGGIPDWGNRHGDLNRLAVLSPGNGFEV